ncbi:PREDICTED: uncharacterized protein LOC105950814 [Erythranthe guttata]|uniref:uncharacterized protein LOC105950814 n=1 Tax=Erythranthe guttata TaxID=4155 RepID=UPI00064DDA66|nr:PREDICTED: uncharacterized protein LOC105950814 [Erythranthe guttata]|eukprot:XP_012829639.1 PREDICTED: uncharacterized protein LOC105950814 [Erythranthe guttata]
MVEADSESGENEESSEEETDDNDSTFSDGFENSDFEYDDKLFDENIDKEIEWVGITDEPSRVLDKSKQIVGIQAAGNFRRSLSGSESSSKVRTSQYHVYRDDADDSDFEFEVGLCFKTASDFREAVRRYSNKQGRPIKFRKNCSDKIQAICECGSQ